MRTILFFDLPSISYHDQKNYRKFHKFLLQEGFVMMQESVYSKICLDLKQSKFLYDRIRLNVPKKGLVQVLTITEKQFSGIEYIIGKKSSAVIDDTERLVIL